MIKVVGIDAGQVRLGLASLVLENNIISVKQGAVLTHPRDKTLKFNQYLNEGIYDLCDTFPSFLHLTRPDIIVAEIIPAGRLGSNSELNVAAITVCKVIAWQWGIEWQDIAANTVKKLVTGDGKATKAVVRNAVISQFPQIGTKHDELKKEQKENGIKAEGYPQDLFDAVAIGWAGLLKYANTENDENKEDQEEESEAQDS